MTKMMIETGAVPSGRQLLGLSGVPAGKPGYTVRFPDGETRAHLCLVLRDTHVGRITTEPPPARRRCQGRGSSGSHMAACCGIRSRRHITCRQGETELQAVTVTSASSSLAPAPLPGTRLAHC